MKLLNRSIQSYLLYAAGIFIISVPLFYFVIQQIISNDVDKALRLQKTDIVKRIERLADRDPFAILDAFGPDIIFNRLQSYRSYDSVYTIQKTDPVALHPVSYRILESNVLIRGLPYKIVVQNSLVNSEDLIRSIVLIIALLLVLIIAGLLLINRRLSKKLWRPFNNTLTQLQQFRVDNPEPVRLQKTDIDEFTDLNNAIGMLSENNRRLYVLQKEFTENASHEMQTPLAVLQSKLELLMQTNPITGEQAALIGELSDAAQRMSRLNKTLLLLTRLDNNQFTEREKISIKEIVEKIIHQYSDAIKARHLQVTVTLIETAYCVMNRTLAEILVSNLLGNAIRHNIPSGKLSVTLEQQVLTVKNSGRAESLDQKKIFTRFQKNSTDNNSIGLGLEIAQKICSLNNFTLRYYFQDSLHCFVVNMKESSSHSPGF
ncbi:MAG: HAMP domain-containing histidine kinase [Chitinophagaceae bacterium]|nr:HAMP domain-containing histidine kinase [Chitinophagaceae bacterium]